MCTIYKLKFTNNKFYIGQTSQPVDERVKQHALTKGSGCPKLYIAWKEETYLEYEILEDNISTEDIDNREIYWIAKEKPQLNTLPGGRVLSGLNHPRSKYSRTQIIDVVRLYLNTRLTYKEISEATSVESGTVQDVLKRRSHAWVWEELDVASIDLLDRSLRREPYTFWDIDNNKYEFQISVNAKEQELGLTQGTLASVLKGSKSRSGWSLEPHEMVKLTSPLDEVRIVTNARARKIVEAEDDMSVESLLRLIDRHKSVLGWSIRSLSETSGTLE